MRPNLLLFLSSIVLRRSQAGGRECALFLNSSLFRSHFCRFSPEFQILTSVFLDSVAVLWKPAPDQRAGAGSNLHRRMALVRFVPTSR